MAASVGDIQGHGTVMDLPLVLSVVSVRIIS